MALFVDDLTPEQAAAATLEQTVVQVCRFADSFYTRFTQIVNAYGDLTPDAVLVAWASTTQTGLTVDQVTQVAGLLKALVESVRPGRISDAFATPAVTFDKSGTLKGAIPPPVKSLSVPAILPKG